MIKIQNTKVDKLIIHDSSQVNVIVDNVEAQTVIIKEDKSEDRWERKEIRESKEDRGGVWIKNCRS